MGGARLSALILAAGAVFGQHGYSPADIEAGGKLYRSNCVNCHGQEGSAIPGTDLMHGKFRRASSDDDVARIIINGVPGTAMPPHNFTQPQAETIVAFLRSSAGPAAPAAITGDAAVGKAVFEGKGGCRNCHRVNGAGSRLGPDLSEIGLTRRSPDLQQSILQPDAEIRAENRYVHVVTRDGTAATGRLLTEDTFTLQLIDSNEKLRAFTKANLREYNFLKNSVMPAYQGRLSAQEIAGLVAYLSSLKGGETQ